jgi:hypothetical protein
MLVPSFTIIKRQAEVICGRRWLTMLAHKDVNITQNLLQCIYTVIVVG